MRLMRDLVGATLSDRYRIIGRIAGGGMGDVYRGHDLLLDRAVAVKVLQPGLAQDPDLVARFKAEARAAARLSHPNVVAVHDWGSEDDRTYFMVMEYVSGTDLRNILVGRGPMDPAQACEVMIGVCDALQAAHAQGLVHRDVKPENVLIARDGTVKVADFGIAALADSDRTLTGAGILGTLRYLSPEQAAGNKATMASDVWAAGAVLFELLTGSMPQGGSGAELLRRRASEPPTAPSELEPAVPAVLDEVVLRACAVDPTDRFASIGEMADALRAAAVELVPADTSVTDLFTELTDEVQLPDMAPTGVVGRAAVRQKAARKRRTRLMRTAGALVALVLLFGGWKAGAAIFGPQEVQVPSLVGLNETAAMQRAEEAGLEIEIVQRKRHPDFEEGRVISQDPASGVLLEGKTIALVVSKGHPLIKLPKLVGKPLDEVRETLTSLGLSVGEISYEFSTEQPKDAVIDAGTLRPKVEEGTVVPLVVSKGPRDVAVPNVVGLKAEKAEAVLVEAGFEVTLVNVYSDEVDAGKVVSTNPAPDVMAPEQSVIEVAVSQGPEFEELKMPDVRNMHVDDARAKLEGMGLRVAINQSCPGTTVIETEPLPGTIVRENDRVVLFVCG